MIKKFQNDNCFILSISQFKRLQNNIPSIDNFWLRDHTENNYNCRYFCSHIDMSTYHRLKNVGVRPCLYLENNNLSIGSNFRKYNINWIVIDENAAISEDIIEYMNFDEHSCNYENSEIRQFCLSILNRI